MKMYKRDDIILTFRNWTKIKTNLQKAYKSIYRSVKKRKLKLLNLIAKDQKNQVKNNIKMSIYNKMKKKNK